MSAQKHSEHCYLNRALTEEEIDRLREFLRQQGIHLPDSRLIAVIGQPGTIQNCPFRFGFGEWTQYCANGCHLTGVFGEHPTG